ncbi:hypothetical protein PsYK624_048090 [Phanerochaete sordida]|uniref:Uncharacterized protein n=1 Tax=Phanerochaete sordida TaxID=48140 RepID=A0A9P3G5Q6_9APHY|nr:hypothetical protein PsYK624_048090 [Phanerochaete sordida]
MFPVLPAHFAVQSAFGALCEVDLLVYLDIGLNIVLFGAMLYIYTAYLKVIFARSKANPPCLHGGGATRESILKALDAYMHKCTLNVMAALALILATTFYLNVEAAKAHAPEDILVQALLVLSMANGLSGVLLSTSFVQGMGAIRFSPRLNTSRIERALTLSPRRAAALLAAPFIMTGSALATLLMYRLAADIFTLSALDVLFYGTKDDNAQWVAWAVAAYVVLLVVHTAVAATLFARLMVFANTPIVPRLMTSPRVRVF